MSYKTILLGLVAGDQRNEAKIHTAISLAASQGAHVTALYMIPPFNIPVYAAVPIPSDIADQYYADEEASAAPVLEAFEAALKVQGDVTGEIRTSRTLPDAAARRAAGQRLVRRSHRTRPAPRGRVRSGDRLPDRRYRAVFRSAGSRRATGRQLRHHG
jgi:hypothetical protein